LRRYSTRTKKIKDEPSSEKISDIMLFDSSKKSYCRYQVYFDDEIGIDGESQQLLIRSDMDEDCSSSDEIISDGVKKALESLTLAIKEKIN
jgi:hypothetical protein